jgi:membrane protease YdiL (CAAX protease family)
VNDGPVSIGYLLVVQIQQLVVVLPVALIVLWLLRTRWLAHIVPSPLPRTNALRQIALGTATALAALLVCIVPPLLAGSYSPSAAGWQAFDYQAERNDFASVGGLSLLFGVQSLFEEALFRAIGLALFAMLLLKVAEVLWLPPQQWKFGRRAGLAPDIPASADWRTRAWLYCGLIANVVLSVGFALVHGANPNVTPIALLNITLASLWLGLLFWRRVSLLAAWLAHYVWNLGLALLGLPISGFALYSDPLGRGIDGARPDLLSGGAFGPEAGLPATLAFAGLSAWLLWLLLRQRSASEPRTDEAATGLELRTG